MLRYIESDYHRLLHFFRAKAYRLSSLYAAWQQYVLNQLARSVYSITLKQPYLHLLVRKFTSGNASMIATCLTPSIVRSMASAKPSKSRALPSEKTVKQVLAPRLLQQFVHLPAISILQKIQRCSEADPDDDDEKDRWAA